MALLQRSSRAAPCRPRRRRIEAIWHELEFATHATTVGAITRSRLPPSTPPFGISPGKQAEVVALECRPAAPRTAAALHYGGWLAASRAAGTGRRRAGRQGDGFQRLEDQDRQAARRGGLRPPSAVREAVGDGWEIMTDATRDSPLPRRSAARAVWRPRYRLVRGAAACRRYRWRTCGWRTRPPSPSRSANRSTDPAVQGLPADGRLLHRPGRRRPHRRHHAVAQGRHMAEAFNVPVCPHFLMELHVSLFCAVRTATGSSIFRSSMN